MRVKDYNIITKKILKEVQTRSSPYIVTIGGLSCSGKTTLSEKFLCHLKDNEIDYSYIALDNWIIDADQRPFVQTVRDRFDYSQIKNNIINLLNGSDCKVFKYNKKLRKKGKEIDYLKSISKGVYVIDGVVALDISYLNEIANLKIFVNTDNVNRFQRLEILHRRIKGLSKSETELVLRNREIDEKPIIERTKTYADILYYN